MKKNKQTTTFALGEGGFLIEGEEQSDYFQL